MGDRELYVNYYILCILTELRNPKCYENTFIFHVKTK